MSIKRYACLAGSAFEEDPEGHWVEFEDHQRALTFRTVRGQTFTHCTMAERAVLDAAYAVPDKVLHAPITYAEQLFALCDAIQRWRRDAP